jgi:hypothetical protein
MVNRRKWSMVNQRQQAQIVDPDGVALCCCSTINHRQEPQPSLQTTWHAAVALMVNQPQTTTNRPSGRRGTWLLIDHWPLTILRHSQLQEVS